MWTIDFIDLAEAHVVVYTTASQSCFHRRHHHHRCRRRHRRRMLFLLSSGCLPARPAVQSRERVYERHGMAAAVQRRKRKTVWHSTFCANGEIELSVE